MKMFGFLDFGVFGLLDFRSGNLNTVMDKWAKCAFFARRKGGVLHVYIYIYMSV